MPRRAIASAERADFRRRVLSAISAAAEPLSLSDVSEAMETTSTDRVRRALDELVSSGAIAGAVRDRRKVLPNGFTLPYRALCYARSNSNPQVPDLETRNRR